jgi:hypothetical protein
MIPVDAKPAPSQAADDDVPVWGADEIAKIIKRTKAQIYHLAEQDLIDVTRAGRLLVSTKRRLLRSLGNE